MPVIQGRFPPELLHKYPHMSVEDVPVWEKYLISHGKEYDSFNYDVRVGGGLELGPEFPENIRRDAKMLTQKRIDAVGYRGPRHTIIEVKPRCVISAVGQLISYRELYRLGPGRGRMPEALLVCERGDDDLHLVLRKYGIKHIMV